MIAKFAKKINEILIQKGIVQKEDAELYRYGIENGIVVAEICQVSFFHFRRVILGFLPAIVQRLDSIVQG